VLSDMMCHTIEATRHLLSKPGEPSWLTPRTVSASIATLKWARPRYAASLRERTGGEVDYGTAPAEDYARSQIVYAARGGDLVVAEATTSWSFSGPGLRLSCELLGPEYSMSWNTLDTEVKLFLSRDTRAHVGEELVEKQNADVGLLPLVADESHHYGYQEENRHMTAAFAQGRAPAETLDDGLLVTEMLMTCYLSAELGETPRFPSAASRTTYPTCSAGNGHLRPSSTKPSCAASKISQARKSERSRQRPVRMRDVWAARVGLRAQDCCLTRYRTCTQAPRGRQRPTGPHRPDRAGPHRLDDDRRFR
jgi:hypothetical protein